MGTDPGGEVVDAAWREGQRAHPTLVVAREVFATFAGARADTWRGALDRAADLYLACACTAGVDGAAALFLDRFGDRIPTYLARLALTPDQLDEVRQIVLVRCVVGDGDRPPALTSYSGRGSLEGWVRATAVREALALRRDRARHVELADPDDGAAAADRDDLLLGHYREPVARAFYAATAALAREHRALLRLHYVHGVTTANLAQMYRVSRATLVRRLAQARDDLFARLQHELHAAAGVPPEECEHVLRLVKSQVDLRLSSLLRETAA